MTDPAQNHKEAIAKMEERWGLMSRSEVCKLLSIQPMEIAIKEASGSLLSFMKESAWVFPGFQFDGPRTSEHMSTIQDAFIAADWDDEDIALWFASPQGSCDGAIPAELLFTEPQRVIDAAQVTALG